MPEAAGFAAAHAVELAELQWRGRPVRMEYQRVGAWHAEGAPLVLFLHEGLGSLSMWKDFPAQLCAAGGLRGLVFSRPAYGRSTPRPPGEQWDPDFMHRQAHEVLPAFLDAVGLSAERPWLFGHSDGGSISLLYAARFPDRVAGLVLLAPHIFVEDVTILNIEKAREAYLHTDLRDRLSRYHRDVDSAFWGWNGIWLDPRFRDWNIEAELPHVRCPVLAVQGQGDEYGTLAQVRGIVAASPRAQLLELPQCGHSPQRDQPEQTIVASVSFIQQHRSPE